MAADSEFRTYEYIRQVLASLGWDTRNPARGGQVYTQGEFRRHDSLLSQALGKKTPENVVVIPWDDGPRYWIVEAKPTHRGLNRALGEAQGYADRVNVVEPGAARFATGIAGTPDQSFYVTTTYWDGRSWQEVAINDFKATGFLSLEQCRDILDSNDHKLALFDDDPDRFLKKANEINRTLHDNEIPVNDRAKIMAALLLALAEDGNLRVHGTPRALIREINGLIEDLLKRARKDEFADVIALRLPATEKNHRKFRQGIVDTLQHLREMNIRSAINSGDDALGKFYETFLKYANSAKEMGIVLTPRHITRFAVEVVGISPRDRVFDPACGTGGFLISAMESIRTQNPADRYERFRNEGLFGIEQRDDVYGLALVNMIFRKDGKSHIFDGNCFDHTFWLKDGQVFYTLPGDAEPEGATRPFSRVLMNPPFKLKANNETEFVDYAIRQMREGGLLFAVLPSVVITGERYADWRRELVKRHTVRACLRLDTNLFKPVKAQTYALILEVHRPHATQRRVFMGILHDDDHRPIKSKMISTHAAKDNFEQMAGDVRRFLLDQPVTEDSDRDHCVTTLDLDADHDFAPERYIEPGSTAIYAARRVVEMETAARIVALPARSVAPVPRLGRFTLEPFIERELSAPVSTLKRYPDGSVPVVGSRSDRNGISAWKAIPDDLCFERCFTIATKNNTQPCEAFWHPYRFSALSGHAFVIEPIRELLDNPLAILYLCEAITAQNGWRFNYDRTPRIPDIEVELPTRPDGQPDIAMMASIVQRQIS